ncbi:MAG: putative AlkP superfamily pyrophosphatase or phosphodiesterase [Brevundimonas sp.]|jgi:predicted AlkP superfamily pyrophosphatase or phosphodiesterase|uniref:alkaline phosphatase family protein n=1 Tax=Brevundimonas sp. TaxID=1871086 RepID=UPI0039E35A7B
MSRLLLILFALTLSACATVPPERAQTDDRPLVILVGIDGFRPDYLERGVTPTLGGLRADGAFAAMRPSFPSVTFPNHYTLVTGVHPDRHGIVNNSMVDADLGRFSLGNAAAVTNGDWWNGGEPIWVTAERAGLTTGTMFWPGSEAEIEGVRPTHWTVFDQSMPGDARVDRVLEWLDLPGDQRPDFATLYFDIVDTAGHRHGPEAPETTEAAASVDASIARLIAGLEARGLADRTTLVIVADHGMAATSPDRAIYLDDLVDLEAIQIVHAGAFAGFNPAPGREAEVQAALVRRHANMECFNKADLPERLAYGRHPRVPAILCLPDTGWLVATRERPVRGPGGAHGYDNAAPDMAALFIAHGPGVRSGVTLDQMDAVDVQPLLARLLGIDAPAGDGAFEDAAPALIRP